MKILAIGDIQHRELWKELVIKEKPDQVIFIGDYFDSFDISSQKGIENFKDILQYKKDYPDTQLLTGNHDFVYHRKDPFERYSGYRPDMEEEAHELLKGNTQMAYQIEDYLFTHAGVSEVFLKNHGIGTDVEHLSSHLNALFKTQPEAFNFSANSGRYHDPYGDEPSQSPIWIRPKSLNKVAVNINQVVGHTGFKTVNTIKNDQNDKSVTFIDTQDSDQSYVVIEDGELIIKYK